MSHVRFEISVSLDGFVTAPGVRLDEPMGDGGQALHEWAFGDDERSNQVLAESQASSAANIAGRRTYDVSISSWGPDGPGAELRTPTYIVSHSQPDNVPEDGVYTFVSSPTEALTAASAVAGDNDIDIFSADIGTQLLDAGLVDELYLHVVPILLGDGTRLFRHGVATPIRLEIIDVAEGSSATHLRYQVTRNH
jgi:dihydrofolate reductase